MNADMSTDANHPGSSAIGVAMGKNRDGWRIRAARYQAQIVAGGSPAIHVYREGWRLLRLPAVSGLASAEAAETLHDIQLGAPAQIGEAIRLTLTATSSLWGGRRFVWEFRTDGITYRQEAMGAVRPGRCYFFANGPATRKERAFAGATGAVVEAQTTYSPAANLSDEFRRTVAVPQSLGIFPEVPYHAEGFIADRVAEVFAPPMLCLTFGASDRWLGVGLGTKPGSYQFNGLEYLPAGNSAQFFVNYMGYSAFAAGFVSPTIALHFGYSPHEVLEQYAAWMDREGCSTARATVPAAWHRRPIFCGWGEQELLARQSQRPPREEATQANYERMMATIEQRGLLVGTLIIDDQWQDYYGTMRVNTTRWPDMAGFIRRMHDKGIHVLLWMPVHKPDGLPTELCVVRDGKTISADVSNPHYLEFLRERIAHLVRDVGVDGFKLDSVRGVTREPGLDARAVAWDRVAAPVSEDAVR
jgi:hypothetical protein